MKMKSLLRGTKNSDELRGMGIGLMGKLNSMSQKKGRWTVDFPKVENWKDGTFSLLYKGSSYSLAIVSLSTPCPLPSPKQPLIYFPSIAFPVLNISYE